MKSKIPIIEINRENCSIFAPYLDFTIKNATFIALDCEMSGLGSRKKLNSKSIDERYEGLCEAVSTRSLLSIGISCFTLISKTTEAKILANGPKNLTDGPKNLTNKQQKVKLNAVTFNILTLCNEDFIVETKALEFLIKHGFDFNRQYAKGILYSPGGDKTKIGSQKSNTPSIFCLRDLFMKLVLAKKPLILHNSLVDLVFLYQHLYGPVPKSLHSFLADLSDLFPAGIYDTKYVADYCAYSKASYLEYLFRKCQRENTLRKNANRVHLSIRIPKFQDFAYNYVEWSHCGVCTDKNYNENEKICQNFALHGCCNDRTCTLSHDVDLVLLAEEAKLDQKKAKKLKKQQKIVENVAESDPKLPNFNDESQIFDKISIFSDQIIEKSSKKKKQKKNSDEILDKNETDVQDLMNLLQKRRLELEENEINEKKRKRKKACESAENQNLPKNGDSEVTNFNGFCENGSKIWPGTIPNGLKVDENKQTRAAFYTGAHRAGFDAFMTGYCVAFYCANLFGWTGQDDQLNVEQVKNKVALSGKDFSLTIQASKFAKTSTYHNEKIARYSMDGIKINVNYKDC